MPDNAESKSPKHHYTDEENIALSKTANTKTPEQLATDNLPFVYHLIDKEFSRYYKFVGIPRDVLISAGMLGLVTAANRSKYGTFIRYASFWIRYYVYAEIRGWFFIKRQSSYCAKLNKIRREQVKYKSKHDGKEPSYHELAVLCGMSYETVKDTIEFDENNDAGDAVMAEATMNEDYELPITSTIDFVYLRKLVEENLDGLEKEIVTRHFFGHEEIATLAKEYKNKLCGLKIQDIIDSAIYRLKEEVVLNSKWNRLKEGLC